MWWALRVVDTQDPFPHMWCLMSLITSFDFGQIAMCIQTKQSISIVSRLVVRRMMDSSLIILLI
jgi:hypothetical protein